MASFGIIQATRLRIQAEYVRDGFKCQLYNAPVRIF